MTKPSPRRSVIEIIERTYGNRDSHLESKLALISRNQERIYRLLGQVSDRLEALDASLARGEESQS